MSYKLRAGVKILIVITIISVLFLMFQNLENKNNRDPVLENTEFVSVEHGMKYILTWTSPHTYPFIYLKEGRKAFQIEKCEFTNCYVTHNRNYLSDIRSFDAVLFHIPEYIWIHGFNNWSVPKLRSPNQKYIISCIESADNYPTCNPKYNNFFNWTWTYKLSSDVMWGYMGIRDLETGKIVGPRVDMQWRKDMNEVTEEMKNKLMTKTRAVAWFVSNCWTKNKREEYVKSLSSSLNKYGLQIDIYGKCGSLKCERDSQECFNKMENDYFFYLAFENSMSEDYITEKFVHPMKHRVVPIVYGGANYSRFAPPGSYIDTKYFENTDELAIKIDYFMKNIDEYAKFFKWTKYYSYQRDIETRETHAFCNLCKALNDPVKMSEHKIYGDMKTWWNGENTNYCK